jgi:isopenicillin N synthase-like dioxygenase
MTRALPIIDLARLCDTDTGGLRDIAAKVGAACRHVGFFYIVNHGIDAAFINAAFSHSARFFALPLSVKQGLAIEKIGGNRGYSGLMHEALDPARGADLKEAFNIGLDLKPDDPDLLAGAPFRSLNVWPDLPDFRVFMLSYFDACAALGRRLHRAFACDFGLDPDFFAKKLDRPMATLRLLYYPSSTELTENLLGAGEHTDYGNVTLLATDNVGGLEVRTRSGAWIAAPAMTGAFIVNIGDCLMRWTNDIYVSTPHRVVNRSSRERYSIAFFLDPNPDAIIEAIPCCIGPGERPRYASVNAADYLKGRLDRSKPRAAP